MDSSLVVPMMMSCMQLITASKAPSAPEELEGEEQQIKSASLKGALCNFFTGCKQIKNRALDARNHSLQELI